MEHISFDSKQPSGHDEGNLYGRVFCVPNPFLLSTATSACRDLERKKFLQKKRRALWRVLWQCKRDNPYTLPDICQVVAEVARQEPEPIPPSSLIASFTDLSHTETREVILR